MENSARILFEDDVPQWYVAMGEQWIGPLSATDVYQKVVAQEISWAHFVWKPGQSGWKRICDLETFQVAVPDLPEKAVQKEVKEASKPTIRQVGGKRAGPPPAPGTSAAAAPSPSERVWFLFHRDTQYGPFSKEEIERSAGAGKLHGQVYAWKDGMEDWEPLSKIPAFASKLPPPAPKAAKQPPQPPKKVEEKPKDKRNAPRRPLVAKIVMAHQDRVLVGVCRDISIGGMQVLTDHIPGETGARIKMNVSAPGGAEAIAPFVAEGVIVRVLEDRRGFSFRFERLSDAARVAIEKYIHAAGL